MADILSRMSSRFDLVICMVGSAACNPILEALLKEHWDPRFFFSEWDTEVMERLLEQQEALQRSGGRREVLLLIDDVVLHSHAQDQLAHMAMRGRHFRVSVCMCAVSYTSLPKRARRSLDTLLVFSCPMKGDMQTLTWEYCQNQSMARFAMNSLKDFECLVLETLEKRQSLFLWRADLIQIGPRPQGDLEQIRQTRPQTPPVECKTESSHETLEVRPPDTHQTSIASVLDRSESEAPAGGS